jgi:hypothetical protein
MRRLVLSLALALTLSAVGANSALAAAPEGAQKAPLFGPHAEGECVEVTPTPKTFGFAILDTPGNEMTLSGEVALKGAAPNATYEVTAGQETPTFCPGFLLGTITTNKEGNGNLHFTVPREPTATRFSVELIRESAPGRPEEIFGSPGVELD